MLQSTSMLNANDCISITFKFGGNWLQISKEDRRKYDGGKQKTVIIEKKALNYELIRENIKEICPWLKGYTFEVHYHLNGTSPKKYAEITSDVELNNMVTLSKDSGRAEIVVISHDGQQDCTIINQSQGTGATNILQSNIPILEDVTVDNFLQGSDDEFIITNVESPATLCIGARFYDAAAFKNALRTDAINNNFGVKMKSSNRSRVVATCSFRGCPWRVRATKCADGQTFEVRKLEATHSCPGVNRMGNKQATFTWVAGQTLRNIEPLDVEL